jgi:hypothetical protein
MVDLPPTCEITTQPISHRILLNSISGSKTNCGETSLQFVTGRASLKPGAHAIDEHSVVCLIRSKS